MTTPNPYGRDLGTFPNALANGVIDLDLGMTEVTGRDILSQSLVRRQTTPNGSVIDCPNDCIDIRGWLSDGVTSATLQSFAGRLKSELLKDERVLDVLVSVAFTASTNTLTIVENFQSDYGPFSLTLTIGDVTITQLTAQGGP